MKQERSTCEVNRSKEIEECSLEVPEQWLRDTLAYQCYWPLRKLWLWLIHLEEELVDSTDWETVLFSELDVKKKIFLSP